MTRTFHTSRRFHPGYSPLGRWLRRQTGDRRRAEALHLLIGTAYALAVVMGYFAFSTLWPSAAALTNGYALLWMSGSLALAGAGLIGFRPALSVTCRDDAEELRLTQGERTLMLPYDAIASVEQISALRFHRHERRYAATHVFIGRLGDDVLLLRTERSPVVIGLDTAEEQSALADHLETARTPARTENAVA